jgi:hypothetical protein
VDAKRFAEAERAYRAELKDLAVNDDWTRRLLRVLLVVEDLRFLCERTGFRIKGEDVVVGARVDDLSP